MTSLEEWQILGTYTQKGMLVVPHHSPLLHVAPLGIRPTVYPPGLSLPSLTAIFFPVEFQAFVKIKQTSEQFFLAVCMIECMYVHRVHDCMSVCMCTVSM